MGGCRRVKHLTALMEARVVFQIHPPTSHTNRLQAGELTKFGFLVSPPVRHHLGSLIRVPGYSSLLSFLIKNQQMRFQIFYLGYGKTGNKERATCFATLLQNELNSNFVLQPTKNNLATLFVARQVRTWVVRRATSPFESFSSKTLQNKLHVLCCPF